MKNSIPFMLLLQVILIFCNAVFACAEIAVISMKENKLSLLSEKGDKRALKLLNLTKEPAKFLATIQVAITLSGFLGSAFAAENFSSIIVNWLIGVGVGISSETLDTISVIVITIILSYLTLIFGELVPKRVAMRKGEKIALAMSGLITVIAKIFAPIVWLLTVSTNGVLRLFGIDPNSESDEVSEEEIRMLLEEGKEKGVIDNDENEIIQNVFEFDDLSVGEIVTHRTELSILWLDDKEEVWEETIKNSNHTFYPICKESMDDIVGILDSKEYFRLDDKSKDNVLQKSVRQPYFIPKVLKADVLFRNMKESKRYFAVVLDEYGGVIGIVTMNDLIEQLLGDFITEEIGVEEEADIEEIDSNTWKIKGSAEIEDIEEALNIKLPKEDFNTFNGLIFAALGKVPEDGSTIEVKIPGLLIKVTEIRDHKVEKAIVYLTDNTKDEVLKKA